MSEQPWYFSLSDSTFISFPESSWSRRVWWASSPIRVCVTLLEEELDGSVTQADSQQLRPHDIPSSATNTSFTSSQQLWLVSEGYKKPPTTTTLHAPFLNDLIVSVTFSVFLHLIFCMRERTHFCSKQDVGEIKSNLAL